MRRDVWLAGLAGVIVGSWLTLIAVQFEFHVWMGAVAQPGATADGRVAATAPTPPASAPDSVAAITVAPVDPAAKSGPFSPDAATRQPMPAPGTPPQVAAINPATTATSNAPTVSASASQPAAAASVTPAETMPPTPAAPAQNRPGAATTADETASPTEISPASKPNVPEPVATPSEASAPGADSGSRAHSGPLKTASVAIPIPRPESPSEEAAENVVRANADRAGLNRQGLNGDEVDPQGPDHGDLSRTGKHDATGSLLDAGPTDAGKPSSAPAMPNRDAAKTEIAAVPPAATSQAVAPPLPEPSRAPLPVKPQAAKPSAAASAPFPPTPMEAADAAKKSARQPDAVTEPSQPIPPAPATMSANTKTVEIVRPFSERAGVLSVGGRSIRLAGVLPTDTARVCIDADGKSWPCGTAARTALRMFLRGRTVECDLPAAADPTSDVTATCRYAKTDLSDWLVRNGWAEPAPGSALSDASQEARDQKRGIYGSDPRKTGKSTLAPMPPAENPLNPI